MKTANCFLLLLILFAAPLVNAQGLKPWPGDNPPSTGMQIPSPIVGTPNAMPVAQPVAAPAKSSSGGGQGSQILQQLGSMLGNPSEIVGGGGDTDGDRSGTTSGNTVDNAIAYKNNGHCIQVGTTPCTAQKLVQGCSTEKDSGKLSFSSAEDGNIKQSTCEDVQMSEELANALDMNFSRCAKEAAGITLSLIQPKIYHIGLVSKVTDANHAHTGSLHEDGRAMDIRAIELGGTVYDAQRNSDDPFFEKFRLCWGKSVNSLAGNCLTNDHPGSVGDEETKHHKDHHLHISMPLCPNVAKAQGRKIAIIELLLGGYLAFAQEKPRMLPAKETVKGKIMKLKNGGEAKLIVLDTGGEPVSADVRISVDVKCAGQKTFTKIEKPVEGCRYDSSEYDAATDVITIRYFTSIIDKGLSDCVKAQSKILKVTCPAVKSK